MLVFQISGSAQAGSSHVRAELLAEAAAVTGGERFWAAVKLTHAPGWHTYYKNPGDSGLATEIEWRLPEGFSAGEIRWPAPERIEAGPLVDYGYHGEAALLVEITPPAEVRGREIKLAALVKWLECADVCIPGKAEVSLALPVSASPVAPTAEMAAFFREARSKLEDASRPSAATASGLPFLAALLFALLGGALLNLMPCVLPVLSIKLVGFLETPREELRKHGLLYGAGVLVSFWALAGVLLLLRAGGEKLGWGFQLQSPLFVVFMALLFFVLALNLLGLFEIGTSLISLGAAAGGKSASAAFVTGALAVLVATPCTAPFMGPALGVALTQSAPFSLGIFTALGAGMAFPYVALSFFPAALRRLPRQGPWMGTMKEGLSFLFFATTVWLLWVLGLQTGPGTVAVFLFSALAIAFGAWLGGPLALRSKKEGHRRAFRVIGLLLGLAAAGMAFYSARGRNSESIRWEPYSATGVQSYRDQNRPVFVDFTAAWCLTCQVNERTALASKKVREAFREANVAALKADWTNRDPLITRALESFGRNGVPLYVFYPPGGEPLLLPAILTADIVVDIVKRSEP